MAGSTPIYGFPYPQSSDLVANYPALGQELAEDVETVISGLKSGLNQINATTIANSGGTATKSTTGAVTFSGVTSVSLNSVFTTTYLNYYVQVNITGSTANSILTRLRAAGTDNTGATSYKYWVARVFGGGTSQFLANSTSFWQLGAASSLNPTRSVFGMHIYNPQVAVQTTSTAASTYDDQTNIFSDNRGGYHDQSTAYDGLTLFTDSGNISGSIRVYGYAK